MPPRLTVTGLVLAALAVPGAAQAAVFGSLTQLPGPRGCVQAGSPERCEAGRGLRGAGFVALSPDDAYLYSVSFEGIAVFARARPLGALTQLPGSAGCLGEGFGNHNRSCGTARGGLFAEGSRLALSPDGRSAYAVNASGIAIFARDRTTGVLSQLPGSTGCLLPSRTSICIRGRGIQAPTHVAVSPDGRNVYTAAYNSGAIAVFAREPATGALTQLPGTRGCVSVRRDEGCARGRALYGAQQLAIGRNGHHLYLAAWEGVSAFVRDSATGALRQPQGRSGCMSRRVRGCAHVRGLGAEANSVALSPDQRHLYVGATTCGGPPIGLCLGSVSAFRRDRRTGAVRRLRGRDGCASQRGERRCSRARSLYFVHGLATSEDGRSAYAVGGGNVAVFNRNPRTGALRQLRGTPGVARGRGLSDSRSVTLSSDGRTVYVASQNRNSVAIFTRHGRD